MAQTHLIFVRMPNKKVIALRHEWLFGQSVLRRLKAFVQFFKNVPPLFFCQMVNHIETFTYLVAMIYSDFGECPIYPATLKDPNNNGITIIDLSEFQLTLVNGERKIKYCLMSTGKLDCHESQALNYSDKGESCLRPIKAETYLRAYYPKATGEIEEKNQELISFFKRGIKILSLAEVQQILPELYKK